MNWAIWHHGGRRHVPEPVTGVPPRGRLGTARNELWAVVAGLAVLLLIVLAFWMAARP